MIRLLIYIMVALTSKIIPKKKGLVVFQSVPDYSNNAKALYELIKGHHPKFSCIWLIKSPENQTKLLEQGIPCVKLQSFRAWIWLFRAEVIVTTHQGNRFFGFGQFNPSVHVNLWHGFSLKGMGYIRKNSIRKTPWLFTIIEALGKRVDLTTATSELTRIVIAASHAIEPNKIFVTGDPRNDWLMTENGTINLEKLLGFSLNQRKVVLYAPTFRDGDTHTNSSFPNHIAEFAMSRDFSQILIERNAICILKLHPNEEYLVNQLREIISHPIYILDSRDIMMADLDLFQILGGIDLLISDYSSVYMEFLLLKSPHSISRTRSQTL